MNSSIQNRYEFVYLFDVRDGNPNGDPDADNMPRIDPETAQGLVTDVCLKRKIRNYVMLAQNDHSPNRIFVKERAILNTLQEQGIQAAKEAQPELKELTAKKDQGKVVDAARQWMCANYFDIRTFGAVMSTGANCGQVRGPVQMAFARSIDRVVPTPYTITRMAVTTEKEAEKQSGGNRTMGRKFGVPYGLYRAEGFISAHLAAQTGFNDGDLDLFLKALVNMFDHDRSAARGLMAAQKLWLFKHDSALGSHPAHKLFEKIQVTAKQDDKPPRNFADYQCTVDSVMPDGVQLKTLL